MKRTAVFFPLLFLLLAGLLSWGAERPPQPVPAMQAVEASGAIAAIPPARPALEKSFSTDGLPLKFLKARAWPLGEGCGKTRKEILPCGAFIKRHSLETENRDLAFSQTIKPLLARSRLLADPGFG